MSHAATTWAYSQTVNTSSAKFVLVALANFADEQGYCYPKQATLAKMTAQGISTVRRALLKLEEAGFIRRAQRWTKKGNRRADCYWLVMSDEPPEEFIPYLDPPDDLNEPLPFEGETEAENESDNRSERAVITGQRGRLYNRSERAVIKININRYSFLEPSLFDPPPT